MSAVATDYDATRWCWLRSPQFDLSFILGLSLLGIVTGFTVTFRPEWFWPIFIVDIWIFGYHHVISTYTRLCFDKKSFSESRLLVLGLLPIVTAVTLALVWFAGLWLIITIYFYWQWFHYTRQSWGISRMYRGKDRNRLYEDGWIDQAIFYSLPALGILYRSYQNPGKFINFDLQMIPVPLWLVQLAAALTLVLLGYWILRRIRAWRLNRLASVHTLYMLTHFAIFAAGYLLIEDITYGWLAVNVWHNAQYILFVWLYNTRRFGGGIDPQARFLSYISQPQRLPLYLLICILITGIFYFMLGVMSVLFFAGLSATIVAYQIVNFHHYIVDSLIWKVRKPAIRQTMGLTG